VFGPEEDRHDWTQLALTDPACHLSRLPRRLGFPGPDGRLRQKILNTRRADPALWCLRLIPGQLTLFEAHRD
jgi:hypothetical protein